MTSTYHVKFVLMMFITLIAISITSVVQVDAITEVEIELPDQAQESDESTDWFGLLCCLLVMIVTIGFPIAIIVFITKIIKGASKKSGIDPKWKDYGHDGKSRKRSRPIRIDVSHGHKQRSPPQQYQKPSIPKRKTPEVEKEIIDVDLAGVELEKEPEMPVFERPQALSDEEKDEFIIDRIMELQEMLKDGEIDQEMYDQLKNRLVDQLED